MHDKRALRYLSDQITLLHLDPGLDQGPEFPLFVNIEGGQLDPLFDIVPAQFGDADEGALDPVIDVRDETGPQKDRQRPAVGYHPIPRPEARVVLVHLYDGDILDQPYHLADEAVGPHLGDVEHPYPLQARSLDDRAVHRYHPPCQHTIRVRACIIQAVHRHHAFCQHIIHVCAPIV